MKIRTINYLIKEGAVNFFRNKLMTVASLSVVTAALAVFGVFFLLSLNAGYNLNILREQPEINVFCFPEIDDAQVDQVEEIIKNHPKVASYTKISKEEAFDKAINEILEGNKELLEGFDASIMPVTFVVKLKHPSYSVEVSNEFSGIPNVEKVESPQKVMDLISKLVYWIPFVSFLLLVILFVVCVLIISNTIKLTVFARRRDINIMKYIGATDWFIRWPFIFEGVIIGIVSAILAFGLTSYGYHVLESRINHDLENIGIDLIYLLKVGDVWVRIALTYAIIGVTVGILGSVTSIRKYLKV